MDWKQLVLDYGHNVLRWIWAVIRYIGNFFAGPWRVSRLERRLRESPPLILLHGVAVGPCADGKDNECYCQICYQVAGHRFLLNARFNPETEKVLLTCPSCGNQCVMLSEQWHYVRSSPEMAEKIERQRLTR